MMSVECEDRMDCMQSFLASYVAELIGASMLFEYSKEAIGNDAADNCCTHFFQTDTSLVIWVMHQAFAFEECGKFCGKRGSWCLDCPNSFG